MSVVGVQVHRVNADCRPRETSHHSSQRVQIINKYVEVLLSTRLVCVPVMELLLLCVRVLDLPCDA